MHRSLCIFPGLTITGMKYESLCIPLCMGREGEGFFFFRAEWVSQIEESLSGCRAVGVARWFFEKGYRKLPGDGRLFLFFQELFPLHPGWTHFYPVNKRYSPDDSLLTKKKSPHLLPKISLTSPIFFSPKAVTQTTFPSSLLHYPALANPKLR